MFLDPSVVRRAPLRRMVPAFLLLRDKRLQPRQALLEFFVLFLQRLDLLLLGPDLPSAAPFLPAVCGHLAQHTKLPFRPRLRQEEKRPLNPT
jgi:hypothetical protein